MPSAQIGNRRVIALALSAVTMLSGCAAHRRDKCWNQGFAYRDYVKEHLVKPQDETGCPSSDQEQENWICAYYRLLKQRNGVSAPANENLLREARNRVINGYLLLADTAYGKFEGDYQDEIAKFSIGSDLVNLGLTAASAVAGPAALLGAAATGTQGVQHKVSQ